MRVFDPKPRDGAMKPPLSREELKARQDRFYARGGMRVEREAPDRGRKLLVFVQCGKGFDAPLSRRAARLGRPAQLLSRTPIAIPARTRSSFRPEPRRRRSAGCSTSGPTFSCATRPSCFSTTTSRSRARDIEALFAAAAREKLDLAQPALTADFDSAWPFLKRPQAGAGIIRVSTVEIMAPLITRRALERAGWAFSQSVSGWGTDLVLGPAVARRLRPGRRGRRRRRRRQARPSGRHRRGRLLRLSAPIRHRPRPRGQSRRRRFRGRAISAAACGRRGRTGLQRARGRGCAPALSGLVSRDSQSRLPSSTPSSPKREHSRKTRSEHRLQSS